tara:strand:+ start:156 stop:338 length:183 start_codon:yes stop_codon:yes gene_type:complete
MINSDDPELLLRTLEIKQMKIQTLEQDIREITKQNYELMIRISQLCDEIHALGGKLDRIP